MNTRIVILPLKDHGGIRIKELNSGNRQKQLSIKRIFLFYIKMKQFSENGLQSGSTLTEFTGKSVQIVPDLANFT